MHAEGPSHTKKPDIYTLYKVSWVFPTFIYPALDPIAPSFNVVWIRPWLAS